MRNGVAFTVGVVVLAVYKLTIHGDGNLRKRKLLTRKTCILWDVVIPVHPERICNTCVLHQVLFII